MRYRLVFGTGAGLGGAASAGLWWPSRAAAQAHEPARRGVRARARKQRPWAREGVGIVGTMASELPSHRGRPRPGAQGPAAWSGRGSAGQVSWLKGHPRSTPSHDPAGAGVSQWLRVDLVAFHSGGSRVGLAPTSLFRVRGPGGPRDDRALELACQRTRTCRSQARRLSITHARTCLVSHTRADAQGEKQAAWPVRAAISGIPGVDRAAIGRRCACKSHKTKIRSEDAKHAVRFLYFRHRVGNRVWGQW